MHGRNVAALSVTRRVVHLPALRAVGRAIVAGARKLELLRALDLDACARLLDR
jgi:hypothetical protein